MKAMILPETTLLSENQQPLQLVDLPIPTPKPYEVLIRVHTCGVCHTELDEIEGRTAPSQFPMVLGHEVVGRIEALGSAVSIYQVGQRVGVGWIFLSDGKENENLSPGFRATGRDVNGGYAEWMTAPAGYTFPIPSAFSDAQAAPLLCAGAIGYRALRLTGLQDSDRLGLTGFGASAHLVLQLTQHLYPNSPIYVFSRDEGTRQFAMQLGATWAGDTDHRSPEPLHAIIDTTPAWKPVVEALANLLPGGRLVINAIRKEDTDKLYLQNLSYHEHLWLEKEVKSVANITGDDIGACLPIAARIPIQPVVETYPLEAANQALLDLKKGGGRGAKVLVIHEP